MATSCHLRRRACAGQLIAQYEELQNRWIVSALWRLGIVA
jgi:hypothetical protein